MITLGENITNGFMTQEERLDYLVEAFKLDSDEYKDSPIPSNTEQKRVLLRSMMNVRMPTKELQTMPT